MPDFPGPTRALTRVSIASPASFSACGPGAFLPADSIASEKDQMRNAFGVPDRIGDRDRATLRQAVKCKAIEARRIDDGFEIADEIFKANVRHLAV